MPRIVKTGLETLRTETPACLKGRRLGLLANPASLDSTFLHARDLMIQLFPDQLTALFSPQHGFYAEKQDNMIESNHGLDPNLGIPIFSLYSETRIPTPEMFDPIDTLVIDIQDVGTRVYTFIYTISYCLEMAARLGKAVVILDRPNPIGGYQVEGNLLDESCSSFVGRFPIPMRHGLTVGEISQFFNQTQGINCELTVITMEGWKRSMYWPDTNLAWIPPSPNLPTPLSCMVYPGQVIYEGTNISEGRGTTLPFEQFGAPFLDAPAIEEKIKETYGSQMPGIHLRPVHFEPTSGKWAKKVCQGFHIHIIDRSQYKPYLASLVLMQAIISIHPETFKFKSPPYEYEYERLPMDLILGSTPLREAIVNQTDLRDLENDWQEGLNQFITKSKKFHLYD